LTFDLYNIQNAPRSI